MHDEKKDKQEQDFLAKKFSKTPFYATSSNYSLLSLAVNIPMHHTVEHQYFSQNNGEPIEKDPSDVQMHGTDEEKKPVQHTPSTVPPAQQSAE